ncbi:hypothetical protein PN456_03185 [Nodularia spumigena CS-586/05]|uniref:hypothetical protein n=1 Tax=Nodularia spumigena TaxID=70799 RepID=UPI002330CD72|nr:hypothetical protein [Nodularia spumigena]MDB9342630.1 hypothetical protein [Nodularia spumigena CS-588/06]MDB9367965.1 hypothetical protein [Nodularia spumigena CS-586/05]
MTVLIIVLTLSSIVGIGFGFVALSDYINTKYDFNILGRGYLSLIPYGLASLGFFVVTARGKNYWESLQQGDSDVVISLVLATIAFMGIITLIYRRTNLWVALLIMLIAPPCLLVTVFLFCLAAAGEYNRNNNRFY